MFLVLSSICRNSADTHAIIKSLKSQKWSAITMHHSSLSVYMANTTPSGTKSIAKLVNKKLLNDLSHFLLLSPSRLVENCMTLS